MAEREAKQYPIDDIVKAYEICEINGASRNWASCYSCPLRDTRNYHCQSDLRENIFRLLQEMKERATDQ